MKKSNLLIIFFLSLFFVIGCSNEKAEIKARHVIFIGLDGWGSYSVEKADMPHVKNLMNNGSYTLHKRAVLPSSSAVNWATMFMGSVPELHGYTTWGAKEPELPAKELTHYGMYPSMWGLVRDAYPEMEIGYIYEWDGMKYLAESKAMSWEENAAGNEQTVNSAVKYIKNSKPEFLGIIFDEPDHIGHSAGHDTPEYYEKMKVLDAYIGDIIQAVTEAGMFEETIFIVTSDHGGLEKGHGGKTMEEMETPFIISGKGIKKNHIIQQSMMQFDVGSTIISLFNIEQPQIWTGRPMNEIFE